VASFVVDENMSNLVARALRRAGHDAIHIRQAGLKGASDARVLEFAKSMTATLITQDLGFGDLDKYPLGSHYGIILMKIQDNEPYHIRSARLLEVLDDQIHAGLEGCLLTIEAMTVQRYGP